MIVKYKKSFTLIELMVVNVLGLMLLNFVFSFQFNFIENLQSLRYQEELAMNSYKLGYMISKGFYASPTSYIDGLISAKSNVSLYKEDRFISHNNDNFNVYEIDNNHIKFYKQIRSSEQYIYQDLDINSSKILDKAINNRNVFINEIFVMKINPSVANKVNYKDYLKLVYTK